VFQKQDIANYKINGEQLFCPNANDSGARRVPGGTMFGVIFRKEHLERAEVVILSAIVLLILYRLLQTVR
jgi:hypothetical protein